MSANPRDVFARMPGPGVVTFGFDVLDRVEQAVAMVKERLKRAVAALDAAGIPHAVVGGHAVAAWVARIDPAAVRTTVDVDLLIDSFWPNCGPGSRSCSPTRTADPTTSPA